MKLNKAITNEIICVLLILLYSYTAFSKSLRYESFVNVLERSPLIGKGAATAGWLLPTVEFSVALLLLFPQTRKYGLYFSVVLLLLFTGYLIYMVLFAATLPCSCGGVISNMTWKQHIFFNLFFIIINIAAIRSYRHIAIRPSRKPV